MIVRKNDAQLEKMRRTGSILSKLFQFVPEWIKPGVKTEELDKLIVEFIHDHGAVAAFKGYRGYPASSCISINEEVVHGIPGDREFTEGMLVSVDIGVVKDDYYGDAARTYLLPPSPDDLQRLVAVTERAFYAGLKHATVGNRLYDISAAIQQTVESEGFSVVRDLVGHGIGTQMHEEPELPNFGAPDTGPRLYAGMTFAMEPMVNAGSAEVTTLEDQWTVVTRDGQPSAHYENTIVITNGEAEMLTRESQNG